MSAPADAEGFRVTDRRRRAEESDEPCFTPRAQASEASESRAAGTTLADDAVRRPRADERSLVGLFVMLAGTAAAALGAPDPVTGETHWDPPQAATVIDLLALLRERTEGHRTSEESHVLDELVYDLQLRYVEVTKRSG